jgi:hypothetical protein
LGNRTTLGSGKMGSRVGSIGDAGVLRWRCQR